MSALGAYIRNDELSISSRESLHRLLLRQDMAPNLVFRRKAVRPSPAEGEVIFRSRQCRRLCLKQITDPPAHYRPFLGIGSVYRLAYFRHRLDTPRILRKLADPNDTLASERKAPEILPTKKAKQNEERC